jgi:hypothetical protein
VFWIQNHGSQKKKIKDPGLGYHHGSKVFENNPNDWRKKAKSLLIL